MNKRTIVPKQLMSDFKEWMQNDRFIPVGSSYVEQYMVRRRPNHDLDEFISKES